MTAQNNNTKVAAPVTQQLREYYTADELDALIRIAERFVGYYTQPGDRASLSGEAIQTFYELRAIVEATGGNK